MTQRMQTSLNVLQMNNRDLTEFLKAKSSENPYITLHLPSAAYQTDIWPDAVERLEAKGPSLYAHVSRQIAYTFDDPQSQDIAVAFLEALDPSGWLTTDIKTVALVCAVPLDQAEAVLKRLKRFEPAGLFSQSLSECLMRQAEDKGILTWELRTLIGHLPLLADQRFEELANLCDCAPADIPDIAAKLRQLNPKPGMWFDDDRPPVSPPDLVVESGPEGWTVALNKSNLPTITVSAEAQPSLSEAQNHELHEKALSDARSIIQALEKRQSTLLRLGTFLVSYQTAFLEAGPSALRPLSLAQIGEALGLHPSTISRALSDRTVALPRGVVPMKAFLSRSFSASVESGAQSRNAVADLVKRIVRAEDPTRPLSDLAIVEKAAAEGVTLARRTVAKFRKSLGIPSSYQRHKAL